MKTEITVATYCRRLYWLAGVLLLLGPPSRVNAQTAEEADTPSEEQVGDATESGVDPDTAVKDDDTAVKDDDTAVKDDDTAVKDDDAAVKDDIEEIEVTGQAVAGSTHFVDKEYLERFELDDVLKVLQAVPGVYIRQEDGYGLRPNIGMRGSGSERSAKIALMEDGILSVPAPYSAPAAYYFPMMTKAVGMEVLKGPSAIRYGPNTVGGSINILMRQIPRERTIGLDLAGGTDMYGKGHVFYGESTKHFGWLIEGVKLHSDGFKILDNGGPTGFDKNDINLKLRVNNSSTAAVNHQLEFEFGYANEVSNETYTGITTDDFAKTPTRRYAGTQLDLLEWQHNQQRLTYRLASYDFDVTAQLYRNAFHRDWNKINRFNTYNPTHQLRVIMLNPKGINRGLYRIITGEEDSYSQAEQLMLGSNDRWFVSQGLQLKATTHQHWFGWNHGLELGTRLHYDRAKMFHTEDPYDMRGGVMIRAEGDQQIHMDKVDSTLAWATYYQHEAQYGPLTINFGARGELLTTKHSNRVHNERLYSTPHTTNRYFMFLPGGGVVYRPLPELELLAGVHRGFVPYSPTQGGSIDPEVSVNYEAGFRFGSGSAKFELIGFFSDFSNLLGTCRFSSGCTADAVGRDFSAGSVHSYGVESEASIEIPIVGPVVLPIRATYTYQRSIFQETFQSNNPQWGNVKAGYDLPYIPEHQVYLSSGVRSQNWGLEAYGHYTSKMRDVASLGILGAPTEATIVVHGAAHYQVEDWGNLYLTVENILDQPYIVSRRPMGARPGVSRRFVLGYKNVF